MVYGIALVYGMTGGAMAYGDIGSKAAAAAESPIFLVGLYFILAALIFKVAAVPFHMWAPDAYEGAPTNVTGFMAAGVKAAAFGALVHLMGEAFNAPALAGSGSSGWVGVVSIVAIATMTLGNLAALRQSAWKRVTLQAQVCGRAAAAPARFRIHCAISGAAASNAARAKP